jgi:hypothetical protein
MLRPVVALEFRMVQIVEVIATAVVLETSVALGGGECGVLSRVSSISTQTT